MQIDFFGVVFDRTIGHEGEFQKLHNDRGNWTGGEIGRGELKGTKWGISAMSYPDLDIKNLTREDAREIYRRDWWDALGMTRWPKALSYQMFDAAFNHGYGRATQFLQRAVGVKDDGKVGPKTISAAASKDINDLLFLFLAERQEYFVNASRWVDFSKGWMRRMAACMRFAAEDN